MTEIYPSFENIENRREYVGKIYNLFEKYNFDWDVCSAIISPYVFVRPNIHTENPPLNTEWCSFLDISKIGIYTKKGTLHLGMFSYPPMEDSEQEKILKSKGYSHEKIKGQPKMFMLTKQINNLECLIEELKDIESVLLKKN